MALVIDTEPSAGAVPAPPSPRRRGPRALSALRLIAGWLLLLVAVVVPFVSVETSTEPVVDCGASAVEIMVNGASGPRAAECRTAAENEIIGVAIVCLLPGFGLVAGRRLRRRARAQHGIDIARMERSGVWQFRPLWRWSAAITGVVPVAALSAAATVSGDAALLVVAAVIGGPWAAYCLLSVVRPRVELTPSGLVVVNPLSRRTVAWADVVAAQPGYWGTRLTRRDGSTVNLWAGQKTNWAVWRGRRSRADAMCEQIARLAHLAAGNLDPTIQLADPARPENRRRGLRNMLIGLGVYGLYLAVRYALLG